MARLQKLEENRRVMYFKERPCKFFIHKYRYSKQSINALQIIPIGCYFLEIAANDNLKVN